MCVTRLAAGGPHYDAKFSETARNGVSVDAFHYCVLAAPD
jgi:hypothetical protein